MQNLAEQIVIPFSNNAPPLPSVQGAGYLGRNEVMQLNTLLHNQIQARAQEPGVRMFMFNTLGQNGFINQNYNDLFNDACLYAYSLAKTGQQDFINFAIDGILKAEVARTIVNNPSLQNYLSREALAAFNEYRNIANYIGQTVRSILSMQNQNMGAPNGMPMGGPVGGYDNYYTPNNNISSMMGSSSLNNHMVGSSLPYSNDGDMRVIHTPVESNGGSNVDNFSTILDTTNTVTPDKQTIVTDFRNGLKSDTFDRVSDNLTIWHDTEMKPVIALDELIISKCRPWGVRKMIDAEGFEALETNRDMIQLHREITGYHEGVEYGVSLRQLIEAEDYKDETPKEEIKLTKVINYGKVKTLTGHTLSSIITSAKVYNANKVGSLENAFEVVADLMCPLDVGSNSEVDKLNDLIKAPTMTQFVDALVALRDEISLYAWMSLHDRLTAIYNRRLGVSQTKISVDSLTEDYADSLKYLSDKLELVAVDRFRDNVLNLMKLSCVGYSLGGDNYPDKQDLAEWGVTETVSVTYVPILAETFNIKLPKDYGLLTDHTPKETYMFFRELIRRTGKARGVTRRYVVTLDNVVIEMHPNDFDPRSVIISRNK